MVEQTKQIAAATKKLNELTEPIRQLSLKDRLVVSVATGAALLKGSATPENLIKDLQNFDPANTDPQVVFDSSIFSYYKGVLVFRHENLGSNFQIFQTIALNKNLFGKYQEQVNTLNHEWGHSRQEIYVGSFMYAVGIAIPSVRSYATKELTDAEYYSQLWERSADILGGVNRDEYAENTVWQSLYYLYYLNFIQENLL